MALPSSGSLSASQINVEINRSPTAYFNLNDSDVRTLAQKASGTISFADLRGKSFIALEGGNVTWADETYTYLAFTSPGTLEVNQSVDISYIIIGGGGGGTSSGGGGGGYLLGSALALAGQSLPVTVGSGGGNGANGGQSTFYGQTGIGGGTGTTPGGCGGGGGENQYAGAGQQGFPGGGKYRRPGPGPSFSTFNSKTAGGGGGGMSSSGRTGYEYEGPSSQNGSSGGSGGQGKKSDFYLPSQVYSAPGPAGGPQRYVCAGGGGRGVGAYGGGGSGGKGAGGGGGSGNSGYGYNAGARGSGGGGGWQGGGRGSDGLVVVRYITPPPTTPSPSPPGSGVSFRITCAEFNGVMQAEFTNCSGTKSYNWQYQIEGVWVSFGAPGPESSLVAVASGNWRCIGTCDGTEYISNVCTVDPP